MNHVVDNPMRFKQSLDEHVDESTLMASLRMDSIGLCVAPSLPDLAADPLKPLCLSTFSCNDKGLDFLFRDLGESFVPLTGDSVSCEVSSFDHNMGGLWFVSLIRVTPPKEDGYFLRSYSKYPSSDICFDDGS